MLRIEKQDLLKWFAEGAKPKENWKIGTEHEKFVFHIDNLERVGYFGKTGISDLLNKLARENNWEKILENNKEFTFKLHQRSKIVSKYIEEVAINPINKETSVLKLKTTSETPGKDISFLNKLTELYIKNGLKDKLVNEFKY
jgi:hypothetical protein